MLTNKPILDTTDYLLKAQLIPLKMASVAATVWVYWMFKPWSGFDAKPATPSPRTRGEIVQFPQLSHMQHLIGDYS